MTRTVREFEKDELREALRKAGEKTLREVARGTRERLEPGERKVDDGGAITDVVPAIPDAPTGDSPEQPEGTDPSDLKCERVQMSARDPRFETPAALRPEESASGTALPVPPLLAELSNDGPFRQALLVWFGGSPERLALEFLGQVLDQALEALPSAQAGPLAARLRALDADLDFLAHFLSDNVDSRHENCLDPSDWEPARTAGLAGAMLAGWLDHLRALVGEPATRLTSLTWESFVGVRETALWRIAGTPQAEAMRRVTQMLYVAARELRLHDQPGGIAPWPLHDSASGTRRDTLAAAADLLHLAVFTNATAEEVPEGDALRGVLEALAYRMAQLVETLCSGLEEAS